MLGSVYKNEWFGRTVFLCVWIASFKANKIKLKLFHSRKTKRLSKFSAIITGTILIGNKRERENEWEKTTPPSSGFHSIWTTIDVKCEDAYVWRMLTDSESRNRELSRWMKCEMVKAYWNVWSHYDVHSLLSHRMLFFFSFCNRLHNNWTSTMTTTTTRT